jgi:methylamine---glutamate N-methyltransferase subunit B
MPMNRDRIAAAPSSPRGRPGQKVLDGERLTTRELNSTIKDLIRRGAREITVRNPDARHNLAVGILDPCQINFEGSVGYYCLAFCERASATIKGNSGWGLGDNLMSGRIVLVRDAGSSVAASMRGGEIVVHGNAGARAGISMKGGTLVIGGSSGFLTGFMMQKGRIIVLGDVGSAAGDSMYEGTIYVGGKVHSIGSDAKLERPGQHERDEIVSVLERSGISGERLSKKLTKIVSKKKLYHYDSLEPLERDRLVI